MERENKPLKKDYKIEKGSRAKSLVEGKAKVDFVHDNTKQGDERI